MIQKIEELEKEISLAVMNSVEEIENFRLKFLSKKGSIPALFEDFKKLPGEEKKGVGAVLNKIKVKAEEIYSIAKEATDKNVSVRESIDYSLPVDYFPAGARHPLNLVMNDIIGIFQKAGFAIADGPEIEDDWHNFTALNFPPDHPARDMQDTFFVTDDISLRTHTSSVQVRILEKNQPPVRIISPGRVYRNEAVSARSNCFFHQIEALYVDKGVTMADMKELLLYFAKEFYGSKTEIRLRPSYFPFTEPSAEMDVSCMLCGGKGCNVCKYTGWLEVLGCGMLDPNVLENCGIDSKMYSGYALGMGIDRTAMLKYGVKDIRNFFDNDKRFLQQFSGVV